MLRRVLKGISAIFAGQFLNIVGNLALVPLFLSRWSAPIYGEWMALSAMVAYVGVTDLGINSAAGNAMTAAYARRDLKQYRHLQASAMAFYLGMALLVSLLCALLVTTVPFSDWIGVRRIPPALAATVTWLLAARLAWQMPAAQIVNIYRSTGDLASSQWFGNLQSLGLLAVTATVLWFRGGVFWLALWSSAPMLAVTGCAWIRLRCRHRELLPALSEATVAGFRKLLDPSVLFGVIVLSMLLTFQGPVLLVSKAFDGAAVALLVTTRTLANVVKQTIAPVQVAMWPELTRLDAVGAEATLRVGHRVLVAGSVMLSAAIAATLWFEGAEILNAWTSGRLFADVWLLRLFLLAIVLQVPWFTGSLFTIASNRHQRLAGSCLVSAVVAVAGTALLIRCCGLLAVPISLLAGEAVACYHFVVKDVCVVLKEDYRRFAPRLWWGVATIVVSAWAASAMAHSIAAGPRPVRWCQVAALATLAAGLAAWRLALGKDDRDRVACWARSRWTAPPPTGPGLSG